MTSSSCRRLLSCRTTIQRIINLNKDENLIKELLKLQKYIEKIFVENYDSDPSDNEVEHEDEEELD